VRRFDLLELPPRASLMNRFLAERSEHRDGQVVVHVEEVWLEHGRLQREPVTDATAVESVVAGQGRRFDGRLDMPVARQAWPAALRAERGEVFVSGGVSQITVCGCCPKR